MCLKVAALTSVQSRSLGYLDQALRYSESRGATHTRSRRSIPQTQTTEVAHSLMTTHMGSTRLEPSYYNTAKFGDLSSV